MIFVSYSWIDEKPDINVLRFVGMLRENGYDVKCDVMFMQERTSINFIEMIAESMKEADKVIVILYLLTNNNYTKQQSESHSII